MVLDQLVPVLQLAIGPVIIISGAGLVLLSITNRYGRVIDRSRILAELRRNLSGNDAIKPEKQLQILMRRARLLRLAIAFVVLSLLLASLLIITLFMIALFHVESVAFIIIFFTLCMTFFIIGLVLFFIDVNISLSALDLEIKYDRMPENKVH